MKQKSFWIVLAVLAGVFILVFYLAKGMGAGAGNVTLAEQPVTQIQIAGPLADAKAEISGLAWYGDNLILMPQYPNIFDEKGDGFLYYIPKEEILNYLDGKTQEPLQPRPIQLVAPELADTIPSYGGFESIGFSGPRIFMTIESGYTADDMKGYLISGIISPDMAVLYLDVSNLAEIASQDNIANKSDEALLVLDDRILTFYEVNGEIYNPNPVAHVFDFDLKSLGTIPLDNLEYRLTDTALAQTENEFWAVNYFFPGDTELAPTSDPVVEKFGTGATHAEFDQVERLVKFQYSESGITLAETPPVLLSLGEDINNWEGLVLLDERGFLMATDKYPTTILGFVPVP